jgi:FKBP-type peptidyl-prolyl cis-trans isomerase FkpA
MKRIVVLIGVVFFLAACNSGTKWTKSESQKFEYLILSEGTTEKIEYGDRILFHYQLFNGDQLIESSWKNGEAVELILPDKMHRNQFMEPLTLIGEGDSLWVRIPYKDALEELSSFESDFKEGDVAIFKYKVLERESRSSQQQKKEEAYALEKGFEGREEMLEEQKLMQDNADNRLKQLQNYITTYKANELALEKGPEDLEYHLYKAADGKSIAAGDQVYFYYQLLLFEDGKVIDNLFKRGERTLLEFGKEDKFIPAFQLALQQLKVGEAACFFVPSSLAYGEKGVDPMIPSKAKMVLDIEIVAVKTDTSKAID